MAKKIKMPSKATAPATKKLYLIRAYDVEHLETWYDDDTQVQCVHIRRGGRIVQIDDNNEGRRVLADNVRRIIGDKAVARLLSGGRGAEPEVRPADPPFCMPVTEGD
jgi:hypothetical protein